MDELKLCPFCGKPMILNRIDSPYIYFTPQCSDRWCIAGDEGFYSKLDGEKATEEELRQEAIEAWSKRVKDNG